MDLDDNKMYEPAIDGPQYAYQVQTSPSSFGDECCIKAAEEEDIETAVEVCYRCHIDDRIDEFFTYEFHECTRRFDKSTTCSLSDYFSVNVVGNEDWVYIDNQYFLEEKLQPKACCEAKM